jgi:hypothetical protein
MTRSARCHGSIGDLRRSPPSELSGLLAELKSEHRPLLLIERVESYSSAEPATFARVLRERAGFNDRLSGAIIASRRLRE